MVAHPLDSAVGIATATTPSILSKFRLDGRVAVLTGASSGLGVHFATALADAGADVVLVARRRELLDATAELVEQHGCRAIAVEGDVTDESRCNAVVETAMEQFGRLDILVNNAGISSHGNPNTDSVDVLRRVMDVNAIGSFAMARAASNSLTEGGCIVNISSALGLRPAGIPAYLYSASKGALVALTRELAANLARRGIRVNAIAPGFVETEMTQDAASDYLRKLWVRDALMRRVGEPDEIAAALLFLASDAASFITGLTLPVDGGWVLP